MHSTEPKNAFLCLRANGWSLRSISQKLDIPKSTLFNWESDPGTCRAINVLKSLQLEKLQERYLPSFEEELQRLSACLARVERALDQHDFEAMRPEFLLRTSLQLRARLNDLRSDVEPTRTLNQGELPSNPLPGCISRSQDEIAEIPDLPDLNDKPQSIVPISEEIWDKNKNSSESKPSAPTTSSSENGTTVPLATPLRLPSASRPPTNPDPVLPLPGGGRYGDLATPLSNIPLPAVANEIALTAGFHRPGPPASSHPGRSGMQPNQLNSSATVPPRTAHKS